MSFPEEVAVLGLLLGLADDNCPYCMLPVLRSIKDETLLFCPSLCFRGTKAQLIRCTETKKKWDEMFKAARMKVV